MKPNENKDSTAQIAVVLAKPAKTILANLLDWVRLLPGDAPALATETINTQVELDFSPDAEESNAALKKWQLEKDRLEKQLQEKQRERDQLPKRLPVENAGPDFPSGSSRWWFLGAAFLTLLVMLGEGYTGTLLAARGLRSWLAALSFVAALVFSPLAIKASILQLPPRLRTFVERLVLVLGIVAVGAFLMRFVPVFAAPHSPEELALNSGILPGLDGAYLRLMCVGAFIIYVGATACAAMLHSGPHDQANPEYSARTAEIHKLEAQVDQATVEIEKTEQHLKSIEAWKTATKGWARILLNAESDHANAKIAAAELKSHQTKAHLDAIKQLMAA